MEFATLVTSIMIMAVIIGIGAIIGNRINFTGEARQLLVTIIVNVAMPCIILHGIFQSTIDEQLLKQILLIFFFGVMFSCIGILIGWFGAKSLHLPPQQAKEMAIVSGLGNTGFIGLPLCAALFGPKGALLAAVYDAGLDFVIWTVGVMLLQKKRKFSFKNLLSIINIPMIAIFVGLCIAIFHVEPPAMVKQLTEILAKIASPLAMLYIGLLIPKSIKNQKTSNRPLTLLGMPITMKLFVVPLVSAVMLYLFAPQKEIAQVVLVQTAMPTIAMASILFARYAADEEMGAMTTVTSTLVGLISIPFVILLGNMIINA